MVAGVVLAVSVGDVVRLAVLLQVQPKHAPPEQRVGPVVRNEHLQVGGAQLKVVRVAHPGRVHADVTPVHLCPPLVPHIHGRPRGVHRRTWEEAVLHVPLETGGVHRRHQNPAGQRAVLEVPQVRMRQARVGGRPGSNEQLAVHGKLNTVQSVVVVARSEIYNRVVQDFKVFRGIEADYSAWREELRLRNAAELASVGVDSVDGCVQIKVFVGSPRVAGEA